MKTKLFSVIILGLLALVMATPAITQAASNSYSFTLNYGVVDGSKNGQFYNLKKGTAKLSGKQYQYANDPNPVGPNTIYYQLRNKTSGNSFGTTSARGTNTSVSGSFSGLGGGTSYYLYIWRTDDGRDMKGSGTVSN